MFGRSRAIVESFQSLARTADRLLELMAGERLSRVDLDSLRVRLDDFELSRSKWEAEVEAELLKAKAKYQAASNAESRARTQKAFYERVSDEDDGPGEEAGYPPENFVPLGDVDGSEEEGVRQLHLGMEEGNSKAKALRHKFS